MSRSLRAAGPVHFFAAAGAGGQPAVEDLGQEVGLHRVASPRHAAVLLVVGAVPPRCHEALQRLHDQLPHPRAVAVWDLGHGTGASAFANPVRLEKAAPDQVSEALRQLDADLRSGRRASSAGLLADQPPVPWRGRGDHGQGGEGMMGGKPYGRPMTMTDDDLRDGLALDAHVVRVGPFAPMFPPGLELDLTLQGDVIQQATVRQPPFVDDPHPAAGRPLRALSRFVRMRGMSAMGRYLLRLDRSPRERGRAAPPTRLERRLRWTGLLAGIEPGLGTLRGEGSDVRSRILGWLREAERPDRQDVPVASPLAPQDADHLLAGLEWGQAATVLASFHAAQLHALLSASASGERR